MRNHYRGQWHHWRYEEKGQIEKSSCEDMFIYYLKYKMVQEKIAYKVICSVVLPPEDFLLRNFGTAQ